MGIFSTEDLAKVSQLSEGNLVLDRWNVVELFPYLGVCDVLFEYLTHLYLQYSPYTSMQEYFEVSVSSYNMTPS